MLSENQIQEIKKQLIAQIDTGFPEDKKGFAIQQIQGMNGEQLEEFLKQNNLMTQGKNSDQQTLAQDQCIFCSIASGKIQAYKIDENKTAIAVLEINPISKGHIMVIPKKHISSKNKLPKTVNSLAEKVAEKLKTKLKPKPVEIKQINANIMGHEIINVVPIYEDTDLNAERKPASQEELANLQKTLQVKKKAEPVRKQPKTQKPKKEEKLWLPRRIP